MASNGLTVTLRRLPLPLERRPRRAAVKLTLHFSSSLDNHRH